ncbi:MAG: hypothetical protein KKB02_07000 [Alphaproteobacteria bacterium]|nr:hypothetical protein [Alphaproteobacteria bacterium]
MTGLLGASPNHFRRASEGTSRAKWEIFSNPMDDLQAKLAAQALTFDLLGKMLGSYLSTKIAFSRILNESDLDGSPVACCCMRSRSLRRDMGGLNALHRSKPGECNVQRPNCELPAQSFVSCRGRDDSLTGSHENPENFSPGISM